MAGLDPAIHVFPAIGYEGVDARDIGVGVGKGAKRRAHVEEARVTDNNDSGVQIFLQDGKESRSIRLYAQGDGGIRLGAQDMGPAVESAWGDSDYEFWVDVPPAAMRQLAMSLLRDRYAGNRNAVDEFRSYCERNSIEHEFSSWV
jgi:hypothetical protein